MSNDNDVVTDIGLAEDLKMDDFIRTTVAQMFEQDNDTCRLQVTLNGTDAPTPPTLELELRLVSIDGVATGEEDAS
jgi:hypothetical protein